MLCRKADLLPDCRTLLTFASLPIAENPKYYSRDKKSYVLLSGGILASKNAVDVETKSLFDKFYAKSLVPESVVDNEEESFKLPNSPGKTFTSAEIYKVEIKDFYGTCKLLPSRLIVVVQFYLFHTLHYITLIVHSTRKS